MRLSLGFLVVVSLSVRSRGRDNDDAQTGSRFFVVPAAISVELMHQFLRIQERRMVVAAVSLMNASRFRVPCRPLFGALNFCGG